MKKDTILSILFGLSAILFFTNCPDDSVVGGPTISVNPTTITLDAEGSEQKITIESNTSWGTECDSWLICSPSSGTGGRTITVYAYKNTGGERFTNLTFYDTKTRQTNIIVRVTQEKADSSPTDPTPTPSLSVNKNSLYFDSSNGEDSFEITSNISWSVSSSDQSWCSVSPSTGSNGNTIKVTVTKNDTGNNRNATITISATDSSVSSCTIEVSQSGDSSSENQPGKDDNTPPSYSRNN